MSISLGSLTECLRIEIALTLMKTLPDQYVALMDQDDHEKCAAMVMSVVDICDRCHLQLADIDERIEEGIELAAVAKSSSAREMKPIVKVIEDELIGLERLREQTAKLHGTACSIREDMIEIKNARAC